MLGLFLIFFISQGFFPTFEWIQLIYYFFLHAVSFIINSSPDIGDHRYFSRFTTFYQCGNATAVLYFRSSYQCHSPSRIIAHKNINFKSLCICYRGLSRRAFVTWMGFLTNLWRVCVFFFICY